MVWSRIFRSLDCVLLTKFHIPKQSPERKRRAGLRSASEANHGEQENRIEPIPNPAVDAAFREALGKLEGDLLIGVINSIGRRKDPKALDALAKIVHGDDCKAAAAARAALGRIRSP